MENIFWIVLAIISIVAAMLPFRSQIMNFLQKIKLPRFTMHSVIWIVFFACLGIISLAIGCGFWGILYGIAKGLSKWCDIGMPSIWTIPIVASIPFIGITIRTIIRSIEKIPQTEHCLVEVGGKYTGKQLNPGIHLCFPYFDLVYFAKSPNNTTTMEFEEELILKDATLPVTGQFFYKIINPEKAAYASEDFYKEILAKLISNLKSMATKYTLEEFLRVLKHATIDDVMFMDPDGELINKNAKISNRKLEDCALWLEFLDKLGVEVSDITIDENNLPPKIKDAINAISIAKKEAEAAKFEKEKTVIAAKATKEADIIKAEGKKQAKTLEGEGLFNEIENLTKAGLEVSGATALITQLSLHAALKESKEGDKILLFCDPTTASGIGAQFGAGVNSTKP